MTLEELSKEQWDDCLIVFDTSAICKMYDMTDQTKKTMVEILDYLKDRIWIPGHVVSEYHKNRIKVIHNPLNEKYKVPDCFSTKSLKEKGRPFINKLKDAKEYHPFISKEECDKASDALEKALRNLASIKDILDNEFEKRKNEINELVENDIILNGISNLNCGKEYDFSHMKKICEEGEFRYRNSIPPGYMDARDSKGSKKLGFDAYGDLFVWNQILDYSRTNKHDVIFICNDEKEDWWTDFKTKSFRNELIKEFEEASLGHSIYSTSLEGFIDELVKRYKEDTGLQFYKGLEAVKDVLEYYSYFTSPDLSENDVFAYLTCNHCGRKKRIALKDMVFSWNNDFQDEREMGPEFGYSSLHSYRCDGCGKYLTIEFSVTEYPAGIIEHIGMEYRDCNIDNHPKWERVLVPTVPLNREYFECDNCGRWFPRLYNGVCRECYSHLGPRLNYDC